MASVLCIYFLTAPLVPSVCPVFQVVVQRVHVDGLGKTKEDLLTYEIADVFQAKNLIDVGTC